MQLKKKCFRVREKKEERKKLKRKIKGKRERKRKSSFSAQPCSPSIVSSHHQHYHLPYSRFYSCEFNQVLALPPLPCHCNDSAWSPAHIIVILLPSTYIATVARNQHHHHLVGLSLSPPNYRRHVPSFSPLRLPPPCYDRLCKSKPYIVVGVAIFVFGCAYLYTVVCEFSIFV